MVVIAAVGGSTKRSCATCFRRATPGSGEARDRRTENGTEHSTRTTSPKSPRAMRMWPSTRVSRPKFRNPWRSTHLIQLAVGQQVSSKVAGIARLQLAPDDRSAGLDLIEEQATTSDESVELVSEILDNPPQVRARPGRKIDRLLRMARSLEPRLPSDVPRVGRNSSGQCGTSPESRIRHGAHC